MLFNSLEFLIFFPVVTILYFTLPLRGQVLLLLATSCIFYMAFIPAYLLVLLVLILIDYFAALAIEQTRGHARKWLLGLSIFSTCFALFIFKYFNFLNSNLAAFARLIHWNYSAEVFHIILPIGLSFHTFQSLSYVIEVYQGRQKVEKNLAVYALYVMFYPQLVAGPIERPQNLLHQFYERHSFDYARVTNGLKLMAWGFFKKLVIADRLALFVNTAYDQPQEYAGISFIVATFFFAFQIYCDFSGYSDIAIGAAEVMGFKLMQNFNRPYFSRSIGEFWRRWHISLSSWFRDYVYIPLGGSRVSRLRLYLNIFLTFLMSGLWHGASWNFMIWGALNGFYLIFSLATQKIRGRFAHAIGLNQFPQLHTLLQIGMTFTFICFAWIFFRANSVQDAFYIVTHLFSTTGKYAGEGTHGLAALLIGQQRFDFYIVSLSITILLTIHLIQERTRIRQALMLKPAWVRWSLYYAILLITLSCGVSSQTQFIYFQF